MYKCCTTEHAARQQRIFEDCLMELLQSKPYSEITISALCERAGYSRYTFYRLYDGKDDVLNSIVDKTLLNWLKHNWGKPAVPSELFETTCRFFSYWLEQKPLLNALCSNGKSSMLVERSMDYLAKEDRSIAKYFNADNSENGDEILEFCLNGIYGLVVSWHRNGYEKSVEQMARILGTMLQTPLLYPENAKKA